MSISINNIHFEMCDDFYYKNEIFIIFTTVGKMFLTKIPKFKLMQ